MFEKMWKYVITRFLVWHSRFRQPSEPVSFRTVVTDATRILVFLHDSIGHESLSSMVDLLKSRFPKSIFEFMITESFAPEHRHSIELQGFEVHIIRKTDVNFFRIIKKNKIRPLRQKQFDLVLDMGPRFDITFAHLFRACDARMVAGMMSPAHPDAFHNVLVKAGESGSQPNTLLDCLSRLRTC
ncbi:hypothetical protein K1X84_04695 [bacterium]|nr:hypothetical protein [bacterium]